MNSHTYGWIAAGLSLVLTGCLSAVPYTPVQRYAIVPVVETAAQEASGDVLAVRPLAYPQHYKTPMVYRDSEFEVSFRPSEEWAELPRDTVTRALRDALSATGYFGDVGDASAVSAPTYVLTGELRRFDEMRTASPPSALCEVRIEVRESRLPGTAVWAKTYRETVPMSGDTAGALAEAMTAAVSTIVNSATPELVDAIQSRGD